MRLLFSFQHFSTELVFAALGVVVAVFWTTNPWLIPFAIAPLILIHRALSVPQLQAEARVDREDGPLQRPPLLGGADGGARPRPAVRAADVPDHGRPRPAPRDQQHVRPSRGRRGAEGHRGRLPGRAAPLRRAGAVRRRGVQHPAPGDVAGGGARDRGAHPPGRRRPALRRRDLERADPRDGVDRRVRLSEGRTGSERPHPPGRPRRLPRQAAGPQPRPRSQLRAAPRAHRAGRAARRGAEDGAPRAPRRPRRRRRCRSPRTATRATRPPARASCSSRSASRSLVGLVSTLGVSAGILGLLFGSSTDIVGMLAIVALVGVGQALALELDDGAISVSAVGALPARPCSARAWRSRSRSTTASSTGAHRGRDPQRPLQHRRAHVRVPRSGDGLHAGFDGGVGELVTVAQGSSPARPTSSSTPGSSRRRSRSRRARRSARLAGALPLARRRTTSSTASSAA